MNGMISETIAIITSVIVLGVFMAIGFVSVKSGYVKKEATSYLSHILTRIVFPIWIMSKLLSNEVTVEQLSDRLPLFIAGLLFIAIAVTDLLDGRIARKYNMVTDFGKFMDPIADKILVSGIMLCICIRCENIETLYFAALVVVLFREFAVSAMRMIMANKKTVVAANILGKLKTIFQIICISCTLLEPVLYETIEGLFLDGKQFILSRILPLTWISTVLMMGFAIVSGVVYIAKYWKYLDDEQ